MKKIESDILKAKELIEDNKKFIPKYTRFERIYPFTNENIKECFANFDLFNKDCLTVLASSDQTLDMCLNGSNNITTFDINPLTEYYFYLKKAALESNITINQYLDFFCYKDYPRNNKLNRHAFNIETFSKIVPHLNNENYHFWTALFNEYTPSEIRTYNGLFNNDEIKYSILTQTINYLSSEYNFNKLQEKIKDINFNFINTNITDLANNLTNDYDFIYLSNIIQYIDELYNNISDDKDENQLHKIKQFYLLTKELINKLNNNGNLIVGYLYNSDIEYSDVSIYNKQKRESIFQNTEFNYYYFKGIAQLKHLVYYNKLIKKQDYSLVYTKK